MLRDLARDLGAVRRSDGGWWPRAGRALAGEPRRCGMRSCTGSAGATTSPRWSPNWRCCCWGRPARSPRRRWWRRSALGRWVRAGMSWPAADAGPQTVRSQLAEPPWLLEMLGLRHADGDWRSRWGCARRAGPRARLGGAACPRHRSPARPARPRPLRPAVAMASPARLPHRHAQADLRARFLAGAGGRQLEPLGPVVLHRRCPRLRCDWARLNDEIVRRSPRALVRSGLGGLAQPSGGPARTVCRRRSGCRPARG
jgi:hypothetical protein